jgi:hypothetical protein
MPPVSEKTVRFSRVCSVDSGMDSVPRLYVLVSSVVLMGLAQSLFSSFQPSPQVDSPRLPGSARCTSSRHQAGEDDKASEIMYIHIFAYESSILASLNDRSCLDRYESHRDLTTDSCRSVDTGPA